MENYIIFIWFRDILPQLPVEAAVEVVEEDSVAAPPRT